MISIVLLAAFMTGGCISGMVRDKELEAVSRLSVVSVVIPRPAGDIPATNRSVLQSSVDLAADRIQRGLRGFRTWKLVDARRSKAVLAGFGSTTRADLAAVFPQPSEQAHAQEAFREEEAAWKDRFLGARGLLVVPREALLPDEEETQKDETVRPLTRHLAGKLCRDLQVDAVAFVQVRYSVTHPRESFIVTGNRTDGLLAVSVTLAVVDKNGQLIVDTGPRPADEGARTRDLLPLYRGTGKDAVKPENIDLADPKKKIGRAFTDLVEDAVRDVLDILKAEIK